MVNDFINKLPSDQKNYYLVLTSFFKFTYQHGETNDIATYVIKPETVEKEIPLISHKHCKQIVEYINNQKNPLADRLLLGLFYYTGLSLKVIAGLKESLFTPDYASPIQTPYSVIWLDGTLIPVRTELRDLLIENRNLLIKLYGQVNPSRKIVQIKGLSAKISRLSKKVTETTSYSPTCFEKTFKKRALEVSCNPYFVSKLTMSSIGSVAQYIDQDVSFKQQQEIINKMK